MKIELKSNIDDEADYDESIEETDSLKNNFPSNEQKNNDQISS